MILLLIETSYELQFHYNIQVAFQSMIQDIKAVADSVIGVAMLVGLAMTINRILKNDGKAKESVIAWIISLGVWIVARSFF